MLASAARKGLTALIERFDDAATPYTAMRRAAFSDSYRYDDYAHLARVAEWKGATTRRIKRDCGHIGDLPVTAALAEARRRAADQQRLAADPEISAWVSANAGTGKTHVLVQRVLRLLLSGAAAESILCLTFTKAAAAEMSNRLIRG